jgi:hypothetical protein
VIFFPHLGLEFWKRLGHALDWGYLVMWNGVFYVTRYPPYFLPRVMRM